VPALRDAAALAVRRRADVPEDRVPGQRARPGSGP
jgi:hypothetical protein